LGEESPFKGGGKTTYRRILGCIPKGNLKPGEKPTSGETPQTTGEEAGQKAAERCAEQTRSRVICRRSKGGGDENRGELRRLHAQANG